MAGYLLWRGPSRLDGEHVVVIATLGSKNAKTGPLVQTWILVERTPPHEAQRSGADRSVCGGCPQRPVVGGACYVRTGDAPLSVWRAYHRGVYPHATERDFEHLSAMGVRAGSYGDPAAVPIDVWERLKPVTGYTHQWRDFPDLQRWVMASADSVADHVTARELGWRTFRVRARGEDTLMPEEIECPNTTRGVTCAQCRLCGGTRVGARSIVIDVHGALGGRTAHHNPTGLLPVLQ